MARQYAQLPVDPVDADPMWAELTCAAQSLYVTLVRDSTLTQAGELGVTIRAWSLLAADRTPPTVEQDLRDLAARGYVVVDWNRERLLIVGHIGNDNSLNNPKFAGGAIASISKVKSPVLRAALTEVMGRVQDDDIAERFRGPFRELQAQFAASLIGNPIGDRDADSIGNAATWNLEPRTWNTEPETSLRGGGRAARPEVEQPVLLDDELPHPLNPPEPTDLAGEQSKSKIAEDQGEASVQSLNGLWITLYKETHKGTRPASSLIQRMGREIKHLLADGQTPAGVEAGLRLLVLKPQCGPTTLAGFVAEATVDSDAVTTGTTVSRAATAKQAERDDFSARKAAALQRHLAAQPGTTPADLHAFPAMQEISQ